MSKDTLLIIRFSSLGDVALTTGLIKHLAQNQQKEIIVLTKESFKPLFQENPFVKRLFTISKGNLTELITLSKEIKQRYPNLKVLDLHKNLRSQIITTLLLKPTKGYAKLSLARRIYLLSKGKIKHPQLNLSVPERYALAYFSLKKIPPKEKLKPVFFVSSKEKQEIISLLERKKLTTPFLVVHPYASYPTKTWPKEYWLEYFNLLEKNNIPYLIIGRSKQKFINQPHDLTNETNLRQTLALLSQAKIVLSTDSGPLHLAWGLNKTIITIFGPSAKAWGFFPYGPNIHLIQKEVTCRPCSLHGTIDCNYNKKCLQKISPIEILELTKRLFLD